MIFAYGLKNLNKTVAKPKCPKKLLNFTRKRLCENKM